MSIYEGEMTPRGLAMAVKKISDSFPELPKGFHDIFGDRVMELGFSDQRIMDAVNHVIDNCIYPKPTIAQFLSFDAKVKLYDHNQMIKLNNELNGMAFKYYKSVKVQGLTKPMWASVNDIEKYKMERFKPEKK